MREKILRKNERLIKVFWGIELLFSEKARRADFYITGSRVVLNGKGALPFGDIELSYITDVRAESYRKARWAYLALAAVILVFIAASIFFVGGARILLYLFFPVLFFAAFLGLAAKLRYSWLIFFAALGLIYLNVGFLIGGNSSILLYVLDALTAIGVFVLGVRAETIEKLTFSLLIEGCSLDKLKKMAEDGLIAEDNPDYLDAILAHGNETETVKRRRLFAKKIDTDRSVGCTVKAENAMSYVKNDKSLGLYDFLKNVVERNKKTTRE